MKLERKKSEIVDRTTNRVRAQRFECIVIDLQTSGIPWRVGFMSSNTTPTIVTNTKLTKGL